MNKWFGCTYIPRFYQKINLFLSFLTSLIKGFGFTNLIRQRWKINWLRVMIISIHFRHIYNYPPPHQSKKQEQISIQVRGFIPFPSVSSLSFSYHIRYNLIVVSFRLRCLAHHKIFKRWEKNSWNTIGPSFTS